MLSRIKREARTMVRKTKQAVTQACAPYEVRDTYGTRQVEWTLKAAYDWLPACSEFAIIVHRGTDQIIAARTKH